MITKRGFVFRGSCFCEKYNSIFVTRPQQHNLLLRETIIYECIIFICLRDFTNIWACIQYQDCAR